MKSTAGQLAGVVRIRDVPNLHPHGRHAGQTQQIPGAGVCVAVKPVGSGGEFVLQVLCEHLSGAGVQAAARVAVVERGDPVRGCTIGTIDVDAYRDIGSNGVRKFCSLGFAWVDTVRRAGKQRLGTECGQATLDPNSNGVADIRIDGAARIDNDHLVGNPGLQIRQFHVLAEFGGVSTDNGADESIEGTEGLRPAGAIGNHTHAGLKFPERVIGVRTEDAIGPARVEAEFGESSLQHRDVVADHHVSGNIGQHAITELPPGFIESAEGIRTNDAVDGDTAFLLESTNSSIEFVVEGT